MQSKGVYDNSNIQRKVLLVLVIVLYLTMVILTLLSQQKVEDIETPILSFAMAALIFVSLKTTGRYKPPAICFLIGLSIWFVADIFWAFDSIHNMKSGFISTVSENLYLVSDYVFLIGTIFYTKGIFKRSDYQRIAVNALIVAMLSSIGGYRFASDYHTFTTRVSSELILILVYLFVSVSTIVVEGMVVARTGIKNHSKSFYIVFGALFFYSLAELRYSFLMMINRNPENVYLDILYYLVLVLFAYAWSRPDIADTVITPIRKTKKKDSFIHWINSGLILFLSFTLYGFGIFSSYLLFAMIITLLVYLVMFKTVQTNALTEELLERQKNETVRLEQMVAKKVKELQELNANLEYISNTDVLTGLYNRRYGMDYLEKIVKDGDNYPIALYSLDLNHFKPINDNYGHDTGDLVLKEVGNRLSHLKQERCTAIRIGGDEFLVVFRNATNEVAVRSIGDLICKAMDMPIEATIVTEDGEEKEHSFIISASIGIAEIPGDTNDIEELYKMADDALYRVKHTNEKSSYLMYKEMDSFTAEKLY